MLKLVVNNDSVEVATAVLVAAENRLKALVGKIGWARAMLDVCDAKAELKKVLADRRKAIRKGHWP